MEDSVGLESIEQQLSTETGVSTTITEPTETITTNLTTNNDDNSNNIDANEQTIVMDLLPSISTQPIDETTVSNDQQIIIDTSASSANNLNTIEIPNNIIYENEPYLFTGEVINDDAQGHYYALFQDEKGVKDKVYLRVGNFSVNNELQQQQLIPNNAIDFVIDAAAAAASSSSASNNDIVLQDQQQFPSVENEISKENEIVTESTTSSSIDNAGQESNEVKSIVSVADEKTNKNETTLEQTNNSEVITECKTMEIEQQSQQDAPQQTSKQSSTIETSSVENDEKDQKNIVNKISTTTTSTPLKTVRFSEPTSSENKNIDSICSKKSTTTTTSSSALLDNNTLNNNQLSKSLKTYSKSNIVWLNIPGSNQDGQNKNGHNKIFKSRTLDESSNVNNKQLTTTIEIAGDDNNDDIGSSKMWYPKTIRTKESSYMTTMKKFNQIQTTNKISGEIYVNNKNSINIINNKSSSSSSSSSTTTTTSTDQKVKIILNNNTNKSATITNNSNSDKIEIKSGSIDLKPNSNNDDNNNKEQSPMISKETQPTQPKLTQTNPKPSSQQQQQLQQPKKRVSYRNQQQQQQLQQSSSSSPVDKDGYTSDDKDSNTIIETITTEIPNVVNFKRKDRRSLEDYCDYRIGNKQLKISIRIQPECRDDPFINSLKCNFCNYRTQIVDAFHLHKNWCQKKLYQSNNSDDHSSSSTLSTFENVNKSKLKKLKNDDHKELNLDQESSSLVNQNNINGRTLRKRKITDEIDNGNDDNHKSKFDKKLADSHDDSVGNNDDNVKNHGDNNQMENDTKTESKEEIDKNDNKSMEEDINDHDVEDEDEDDDDDDEDDEEIKKLDGFSVKDIVWIEMKKKSGLWPALIIDISMNDKKLVLRAIDYVGKNTSFKAPTKSVVAHDSTVVNKFLKNHPNESRTVQKVEQYLRKLALEDEINPIEFFFEPNTIMNSNDIQKTGNIAGTGGIIGSNNNGSTISIDGSSIYQFIKNGSVDSYLRSIHQAKIENNRHKIFLEKQQEKEQTDSSNNVTENNGNNNEQNQQHFGPIEDEDQQYELFLYLRKLYEDCLNENGQEKNDETIVKYIYSVWIPEAIIKAISKKYQIDMEKAGQYFDEECSQQKSTSLKLQNIYLNI